MARATAVASMALTALAAVMSRPLLLGNFSAAVLPPYGRVSHAAISFAGGAFVAAATIVTVVEATVVVVVLKIVTLIFEDGCRLLKALQVVATTRMFEVYSKPKKKKGQEESKT